VGTVVAYRAEYPPLRTSETETSLELDATARKAEPTILNPARLDGHG
jgi:hypothetical protein